MWVLLACTTRILPVGRARVFIGGARLAAASSVLAVVQARRGRDCIAIGGLGRGPRGDKEMTLLARVKASNSHVVHRGAKKKP